MVLASGDRGECPEGTSLEEEECLSAIHDVGYAFDPEDSLDNNDGWSNTPCGCFLSYDNPSGQWHAKYDRGLNACVSNQESLLICKRQSSSGCGLSLSGNYYYYDLGTSRCYQLALLSTGTIEMKQTTDEHACNSQSFEGGYTQLGSSFSGVNIGFNHLFGGTMCWNNVGMNLRLEITEADLTEPTLIVLEPTSCYYEATFKIPYSC